MKKLLLAASLAALMGVPALAEDFHGYDPATFDGAMLPAADLAAMVADAVMAHPPKNGKQLVIGFANLQRDIPFCALVETGIMENAKAAGIDVVVADNKLDGATALSNAESFITRDVDLVIEFQTDAAFGATIMQKMNDAKIPVIAIDIPMGDAKFFGVNNPRAGFMGGSYLGEAAIAKFGMDKVKAGYFIHGELPQSGPIPAMRTGGQTAGLVAVVPDLPADHVLGFDSKNTLDEAFAQTNNLLGKIPDDAVIMGTGINDQVATGILRAAEQAGRKNIVVVGLGADEKDSIVKEADYVAAVGSFPERYGNSLVPMALATLAGKTLPDAVLINHVMVTKENACNFYKDAPCATGTPMAYTFPQEQFAAHLAALQNDPTLKDVKNLIPTK